MWRLACRLHRGCGHAVTTGLLCVLIGCAYSGQIDNPVQQKFIWFSYLAGDDLRGACADPGVERYRLIYNGRYDEQVRTYEIVVAPEGGGRLTARVQGPASLTELRADDLLAPWRWQKAEALLDAEAVGQLRGALGEAGFFGDPAVGLELNSKAFYWAAVGCRQGRFYFGGWQFPSKAFDRLAFPALLFGFDQTGEKVNPPRPLTPSERGRFDNSARDRGGVPRFLVRVGRDGLSGGGAGL